MHDTPSDGNDRGKSTVSFKTWIVLLNKDGKVVKWLGGASWDFVHNGPGDEEIPENSIKKLATDAPTKDEFDTSNEHSGIPARWPFTA
jgi:hypothetical protein